MLKITGRWPVILYIQVLLFKYDNATKQKNRALSNHYGDVMVCQAVASENLSFFTS